jgi:rod shape-determining protein MreC
MASSQFSSRASSVLRRRLVVAVLVLVSLALLTVYFRESSGGGLHSLQSTGASVLKPFETAANRVAQPFRDAAGWLGSVTTTSRDNRKLRKELQEQQVDTARYQALQQENRDLRAITNYIGGPSLPRDYTPLPTAILSQPPEQFDQRVVVGVGRNEGVLPNDPVVSPTGVLVGVTTTVGASTANVKLITDETSAVSVVDAKTGAWGILHHDDPSTAIVVDNVPKAAVVNEGDRLVTAGWKSGALTSVFPRGIPVGTVKSVNQTDIYQDKQIEITPLVDFGSLRSMIVLVKKPSAR